MKTKIRFTLILLTFLCFGTQNVYAYQKENSKYKIVDTITIIPNYDIKIPIFKNVIKYKFIDNFLFIKQIDNTTHYISKDLILRFEIIPNSL